MRLLQLNIHDICVVICNMENDFVLQKMVAPKKGSTIKLLLRKLQLE